MERVPSTILIPLPGAEPASEELVHRLLSDAFPMWGKERSDRWEEEAPAGVPWVLAARIPDLPHIAFIWTEAIEPLPEEAWWVSTDISEDELDAFEECTHCMVVETMLEGDDPRSLWQQQVRVALSLAGDSPFIYDDSSMRIMTRTAAESVAELPGLPPVWEMFSLHALYDEEHPERLWMHTHGLARAGVSDVEVIDISSERRTTAAGIISLVAGRLMDGEVGEGDVMDVAPGLSLELMPLEEGLNSLKTIDLGNLHDRDELHLLDRLILLAINPMESQGFSFFSSPVRSFRLDGMLETLERHEVIYHTKRETRRMNEMAQYHWPLFLSLWRNREEEEWTFLVKIAFAGDGERLPNEHLWFEVHKISMEALDVELISKPISTSGITVGERLSVGSDRIIDWSIGTEEGVYDPTSAVRLATRNGVPVITPKPIH